jgi:molybdopterin-guanine dinucleotide biosynthesis protein
MLPDIIHIQVIGPTASGKTAIASLIRKALQAEGLCVASPSLDAEARTSPVDGLPAAPSRRERVVVIGEQNIPRS